MLLKIIWTHLTDCEMLGAEVEEPYVFHKQRTHTHTHTFQRSYNDFVGPNLTDGQDSPDSVVN